MLPPNLVRINYDLIMGDSAIIITNDVDYHCYFANLVSSIA